MTDLKTTPVTIEEIDLWRESTPADYAEWDLETIGDCDGYLAILIDRMYAETARADAAEAIVNAAQCIRHWHDAGEDGMVVSSEHVRKLWQTLADYEEQKP